MSSLTSNPDSAQRLANLENRLARLETLLLARDTLAQQNNPRDMRLIETVAVEEDDEETYPERTPEDEILPRVFPFRFVDGDFMGGLVNGTPATTQHRSTAAAEIMYGYAIDGLYLPQGFLGMATWQRGPRKDEDDEEFGEWWIFGGELFVPVFTTAIHAKGVSQNCYVATGDPPIAGSETVRVLNPFHAMGTSKRGTAVKIGTTHYEFLAGDCS